jgi:S1-C subfamily serine protease
MSLRHVLAALVAIGLLVAGVRGESETQAFSVDDRAVEFATLPCVGIQSTSSGYVIDDELVLTVAHALHETRDFAVLDSAGVWRRGDVVRLDLARDLALVRVDGIRSTPVEMAPSRAVADWPDTPVRMVAGAASGSVDASIVRRVRLVTQVVGDRSEDSRRSGYEVALDIGPGDSGAALIDTDDQLVAIVFARSTQREAVAWATALDEVDTQPAPVPASDCGDDLDIELDLRRPEPERLAG